MGLALGRYNKFAFQLPLNFFPETIVEKYKPIIHRIYPTFDNLVDYINHTIKKIDVPSISQDIAIQNNLTVDVGHRSSLNVQTLFDKDITITFNLTDGYLNLIALTEIFLYHYAKLNTKQYIDPFRISLVDSYGSRIAGLVYTQILFTALDGFTFDFSDGSTEFSEFSATFKFNKINFDVFGDGIDNLNNDFGNFK